MANKMIITCALTGAETTKAQAPALPVTPEELAASAEECWKAGASIVHLHARKDDGTPTAEVAVFKKAIELIRKRCDVVIEITTGGAVRDATRELRQQGAIVRTVICAIDRSPEGENPLADMELEVRPVLTKALLDAAREQ